MELLFMIKYFQEDLAIFSLNLSTKRKQKERKGHSEGFFWGGYGYCKQSGHGYWVSAMADGICT